MLTVSITNRLELTGHLPGQVKDAIRARLTFTNPQWEENEHRGFSNWQTPRGLCYLEDHGDMTNDKEIRDGKSDLGRS
jgi:hypothetical protein